MSDLVAFLRARLDEDETAANKVYGWWREHGQRAIADDSYAAVLISDVDPDTRTFILRNDPARVLREVEAKRKMLAEFEMFLNAATSAEKTVGYDPAQYENANAFAETATELRIALRIMAGVWSDHPDYDPAWQS